MNLKLSQYESKKLFYNKFLYCLTAINQLGSIFRNKNFKYASTQLDMLQAQYESGQQLALGKFQRFQYIKESDFFDAKTIYNELTRYRQEYIVRIESPTMNFYSNDKDFLQRLGSKLAGAIEWHQPDSSYIDFLKDNGNTILVDDDTYSYKVTFNSNRPTPNLAEWLYNNKDKVKSSSALREDIQDLGYVNGRYIYVTTENVLMLLKIIAGDCIQRIDKLVCKQSIDK